ncbi:hypothetical protein GF386_05295 [Candidatus Pacearchaeota archaeon]|nr:hypothetical protein [Candidatus Pacearchaeota archaeon]
MANYNLTNITDANTILEQFTAINSLTGDIFAILILFTIYILLFIVFKNYDTRAVLVTNGFIITIISITFLWAGLIGTTPVVICVAALVLSIVLFMFWR